MVGVGVDVFALLPDVDFARGELLHLTPAAGMVGLGITLPPFVPLLQAGLGPGGVLRIAGQGGQSGHRLQRKGAFAAVVPVAGKGPHQRELPRRTAPGLHDVARQAFGDIEGLLTAQQAVDRLQPEQHVVHFIQFHAARGVAVIFARDAQVTAVFLGLLQPVDNLSHVRDQPGVAGGQPGVSRRLHPFADLLAQPEPLVMVFLLMQADILLREQWVF